MSIQIIPLTTDPNKTFQCKLAVDSKNITLEFNLKYNEIAGYWIMKVSDPTADAVLIDSIPLVPGDSPAANILYQYGYLGIGSAYIVKTTSNNTDDHPDSDTLGTDFVLVWSDTPS